MADHSWEAVVDVPTSRWWVPAHTCGDTRKRGEYKTSYLKYPRQEEERKGGWLVNVITAQSVFMHRQRPARDGLLWKKVYHRLASPYSWSNEHHTERELLSTVRKVFSLNNLQASLSELSRHHLYSRSNPLFSLFTLEVEFVSGWQRCKWLQCNSKMRWKNGGRVREGTVHQYDLHSLG